MKQREVLENAFANEREEAESKIRLRHELTERKREKDQNKLSVVAEKGLEKGLKRAMEREMARCVNTFCSSFIYLLLYVLQLFDVFSFFFFSSFSVINQVGQCLLKRRASQRITFTFKSCPWKNGSCSGTKIPHGVRRSFAFNLSNHVRLGEIMLKSFFFLFMVNKIALCFFIILLTFQLHKNFFPPSCSSSYVFVDLY